MYVWAGEGVLVGRCVLSERLASALRVVGTLCAVACVLACTFVDIVLVLECSVSSELGSVSFCVFRVQRVGFRVLLRLSGAAWVGSRVTVSFAALRVCLRQFVCFRSVLVRRVLI